MAFATNRSGIFANPAQAGFWRVCLTGLLLLISGIHGFAHQTPTNIPSQSSSAPASAEPPQAGHSIPTAAANPTLIHFPQIYAPDPIWQDTAIWAHDSTPAEHEVALFRYEFNLAQSLQSSELHIFADTRYETWLDGRQVGRGPARFSKTLREYDVYPLGDLPPGQHLIAVLVQWAPNNRRSESSHPHLIGHIQGQLNGEVVIPVRTSSAWKSRLSDAWRQDSAPVHAWGLIGPTEILDLRRLPANWNQAAFNDSDWSEALSVGLVNQPDNPASLSSEDSLIIRARSIPLLAEYTITPTVMDVGLVSPGFKIGEITAPFKDPFTLSFNNPQPATLTIKALAIPNETAAEAYLDGASLTWKPLDVDRPDLYAAQVDLPQGEHTLTFAGIPPRGMTFSLPAQGFIYKEFPFKQGVHAGRRLLLADLVSDSSSVIIRKDSGLTLEFGAQPSYAILDLGRTRDGRLHASVEGPPGTLLDIGWDERLTPHSNKPLPYPGSLHLEWNQTDSWALDGKVRSIATLDSRSGRYILIVGWGGPLKIKDIRFLEDRYPLQTAAAFLSSDPLLDRIWRVGLDTLYPNMQDAYTDTPWRERGQWWGDAYIADHVNQVSLGDLQLIRRGLGYMADALRRSPSPGMAPNSNDTHILDYGMLWVSSLSEYYQNTSDHAFLQEIYPSVSAFIRHLAQFENPETGLLDLPKAPWAETAYIESLGYHSRYGQSTALNAMYYETLSQAAFLAEQVDDMSSAQRWKEKAALLRGQINRYLYLPEEGRYFTTLFQGVKEPPTPQAQAWALAYGLVDVEHTDSVVNSLLELLSVDPSAPNLDVYGMHWVLEALGKTGHIKEALEIIKRYYEGLLAAGATTWWEKFEARDQYSTSLSHVWGGSPTWFLSTYLLGAERTGPQSWRVKPALNGISFASGSIKLQSGRLDIGWVRQTCQAGTITIRSDANSQGALILLLTDPVLKIQHNGETIWQGDTQASTQVQVTPQGLQVNLLGGTHTFLVEFDC